MANCLIPDQLSIKNVYEWHISNKMSCLPFLVRNTGRISDWEMYRNRFEPITCAQYVEEGTGGGDRRAREEERADEEEERKNTRSLHSWFIPSIFPKMHWSEEVYCEERAGMTPFTARRWHRRVYKELKRLTKKHKYNQPICTSKLFFIVSVPVWQRDYVHY